MVGENKSSCRRQDFSDLSHHPQWLAAENVIRTLQNQGYEALLAGGAVRDLLMNRLPGDLDVATSALPDEVEKIFPQTVAVGKAFGVIRVLQQGHSIEVATYREDLAYRDGRRPEGVRFTNRVEDAKRRDFTVNALFYDPIQKLLYDDVNGEKDLRAKLLKCVGNPAERFQEDELRRYRLIRFVSQLGFEVDPETWKALCIQIEGIQKVSRERITEETLKMWKGGFLAKAFSLWMKSGLGFQVDPAWKAFDSSYQEALADIDKGQAEIWKLPRHDEREAWVHYFSFFFDQTHLKNHLGAFKLSSDLQKWVQQVHLAYQNAEKFTRLSRGEQRYQSAQPGFDLGFLYAIYKKFPSSQRSDMIEVLQQIRNAGPLPAPLVRATQLQERFPGKFQGPHLGRLLHQLFLQQLNNNWTDIQQAWAWMDQNKSH